MTSINHFNLRSFDLNLLVAFDALMTEGSVTRAAQRLKIGQPAMSHSLSTLRVLMQDELFIRVGQTMQPTAKAKSLSGPVRKALRQAEYALRGDANFDPRTEERVFRVVMSPEIEMVLLPDLTSRLQARAPGMKILARIFQSDATAPSLEEGLTDLAIGCSYDRTSRRSFERLYDSEVACCFNPDQLPLSTPLTQEDYVKARHAVISQTDSLHGCMKEALELAEIDLDVAVAGSSFMALLAAAATSPIIATVPRRIAERYAPLLGLAVSPMPLRLILPPVTMVWPAHTDSDPAAAWLREEIRETLNAAGMTTPVQSTIAA